MKYLKTYEKYQLGLFPDIEIDKPQDILKKFTHHYKPQKKTVFSDNYKSNQDVIKDYDNRNTFNRMCNNLENIDEGDIMSAAIDYFYNNEEILIDYLKDTGEYGKYFNDIDSEEDKIKKAQQYIEKRGKYDDIYDIVADYDEFIIYIINSYKNEFDYSTVIDDEYWDTLIYVLRHSEKDNKIPVYRAITIPKTMKDLERDLKDYKGVGVYWSYSENGATSHCGRFGADMQEIILKAWVDVANVEWNITFERTIYSLKDEQEVYLIEGSDVELYEIYLPGRKGDIMKNFNTKYFEEMYDFDSETIMKLRNSYEIDAKDKSTIIFDPPIDITV